MEIFGITANEALGRDLTELIVPVHVHHIRPLDLKPRHDRRHLRRAPACRSDGTLFTAEFTVLDLVSDAGATEEGSVISLRDASAMGETVRGLRTRVAQLEADMQRLVALARPASVEEAATASEDGRRVAATIEADKSASGADNAHTAQQVGALLASQVQCVLATTTEEFTPATFLMAYAASSGLQAVFVATPLRSRKAQQMLERPSVSLLWDNRTGNLADHTDGLLVTATGQAMVAPRDELPSVSEQFLARNPNMGQFLASEGVAVFKISVESFEVVEGYGRPRRWDPRQTF